MARPENIYVLGCGAVGLALSAHLVAAGREVIAVRTSVHDVPSGEIKITMRNGPDAPMETRVRTVPLSRLTELDGLAVITAKSYANAMLAAALADKKFAGPLVILQNGLGVEKSFLEKSFAQIYRCVLYVTGQTVWSNEITFRPIKASPIGIVKGSVAELEQCVRTLMTEGFPFRAEPDIQRDIWKKVIINSVFNSLCPLLDTDNGIFVRDEAVASLAKEIIGECLPVAKTQGVSLTESELMEQIMNISRGSDGVLISTLQDIRNGRSTEMESLNLEICRLAAIMNPKINLPRTELLGRMILAKSNRPAINKLTLPRPFVV
jgi:2-dehydropantoate 2-reductase